MILTFPVLLYVVHPPRAYFPPLALDRTRSRAMSPASEVAWSEAWRKSFQCKPYDGDRTDAIRFMREFVECTVLIEADDDYTVQDVLTGRDRGGVHAD